jgi:hypothetical protein
MTNEGRFWALRAAYLTPFLTPCQEPWTHETAVKGNKNLRKAELDVASFNAAAEAEGEAAWFDAAAASSQPDDGAASGPAEGSAQDITGIAAELERLAALHSSGMLDDEEFRAAKARIIHGG